LTLKQLIAQGLAPLLSPLGFQAQGRALLRSNKTSQDLVEFELDPHDSLRFRPQLGVHYPALLSWVVRFEPYKSQRQRWKPLQWQGCAHHRELVSGRWWHLNQLGSNARPMLEELTVLLLEQGLPWFQARRQPASLLEPGAVPNVFTLAAVRESTMSERERWLAAFRAGASEPISEELVAALLAADRDSRC
jgi:hypothetical protein